MENVGEAVWIEWMHTASWPVVIGDDDGPPFAVDRAHRQILCLFFNLWLVLSKLLV